MKRRSDRPALVILVAALHGPATARAGEADATYQWRAPIEVLQTAPFVYLELPASAYAHALQPDYARAIFIGDGQPLEQHGFALVAAARAWWC